MQLGRFHVSKSKLTYTVQRADGDSWGSHVVSEHATFDEAEMAFWKKGISYNDTVITLTVQGKGGGGDYAYKIRTDFAFSKKCLIPGTLGNPDGLPIFEVDEKTGVATLAD